MGQMRILGSNGHGTMVWDEAHATHSESECKAEFDRLIAANYIAFDVGKDSQGNRKLTKFEPGLDRMTVIPPMAGGSL